MLLYHIKHIKRERYCSRESIKYSVFQIQIREINNQKMLIKVVDISSQDQLLASYASNDVVRKSFINSNLNEFKCVLWFRSEFTWSWGIRICKYVLEWTISDNHSELCIIRYTQCKRSTRTRYWQPYLNAFHRVYSYRWNRIGLDWKGVEFKGKKRK